MMRLGHLLKKKTRCIRISKSICLSLEFSMVQHKYWRDSGVRLQIKRKSAQTRMPKGAKQ